MYHYLKRALDVFFSALLLLLLWPALAVLMAAVRADSKGPAIFRQVRAGRGRRLFTIYKLRTMAEDAERFAGLLAPQGTALKDRAADPRITRIGRFLRKYSLDELPQLINVFKGDMSLVGPRPLVLPEVNALPAAALQRFDVRPGMTGFAQVDCRETTDQTERLCRDIYYVQHCSPALDLRILLFTLREVILGGNTLKR